MKAAVAVLLNAMTWGTLCACLATFGTVVKMTGWRQWATIGVLLWVMWFGYECHKSLEIGYGS